MINKLSILLTPFSTFPQRGRSQSLTLKGETGKGVKEIKRLREGIISKGSIFPRKSAGTDLPDNR